MKEELPNRIRELRQMMDLSQADLGARAGGANKSQINKLETGGQELTLTWMRRIAAALTVSPADLLVDDDNPYRLNDIERELIDLFRGLDRHDRDRMFRLLVAFCTPANENRAA
jgi:transcriptional regulator with XRE-family HTH domain